MEFQLHRQRWFSLATALLCCAASLSAGAQDANAGSRKSAIAGTVVQEPASQPLKKVLVQVVAENQKEGGNYSASTDGDGHFRIENVVPGRYRLFVERSGFVGVNERGQKSDTNILTVQAGQSVDDLVLRMLPTAVITGRITDEDGDPMSGVRMVALKKVPGKGRRQAQGTEATNDLGEYRLAGLFPGQYLVVAMPPPDFRDYEQRDYEQRNNEQRDREQRGRDQKEKLPQADPRDAKADTRYLTTYYPGTYDAAQASPLSLKAGDEIPVNLTLIPSRTYRVRGIVTGITPGQKPIVELVSKAGDSIHASEVRPDGQFELRGVGPGSYIVRASIGSESVAVTARQEISVVSGDVEGVKLSPQPSFSIFGRLHVEGASVVPTQFSVDLRTTELPEETGFFISQEAFGASAPVDRLGNFEWKHVNSGNYIVRLFGGDPQSNFFLKSAKLGGRDIETGFTASGPASLDVTVSFKAGIVEGLVFEKEKDVDNNCSVANAAVVAVPEEKYRKLPDRFGIGETDQRGRFTIRGLAPGSYSLYAWQDVDESLYRDAEFLRSQEANGVPMKIEEGSHQTVELKLSPAAEEWR
jgi:Carboxypeptidase regulatory-like domain